MSESVSEQERFKTLDARRIALIKELDEVVDEMVKLYTKFYHKSRGIK